MRTVLRSGLIVAGLSFAASCTGDIGDPDRTLGGTINPPMGGSGGTAGVGGGGSGPGGSGGGQGGSGGSAGSGGGGSGGSGGMPVAATDPGRVTLHRLNRVEYNNTVRDLLETTQQPANDFPADDRGYGFDNIADVLALSPVQIELYQRAAELLVDEAMRAGAARDRIVTCDLATGGDACADMILRKVARRAWRRPVTDDEVRRLMGFVSSAKMEGDNTEVGVRLGLQSILLSPHFIFRVEIDPAPTSLAPRALTSHEMASRLSYFIWSSMPDDQLFAAADAGTLGDKAAVMAQVSRMLASPKADALVDNFAGQWLHIRAIGDHDADAMAFPLFDEPLRDAMRMETNLMFREALSGALPVDQLLTADFSFVNDRLAKHYGLPAVGGTQHKRVSLAGTPERRGILTGGTILTVTSYPTRTSPVVRGRWVLDELLCTPPQPPPPGVEGLKDEGMTPTGSLRDRLEQHRTDPTCASCHSLMDPIGFGLENYDGIGIHRTTESGFPVDASGEIDGKMFNGAVELARILSADPRFVRCLTEKMYVYALGRGVEDQPGHMDMQTIDGITERFATGGYKLKSLLEEITLAETFRKRRGEPAQAGGSP